MKKKMGVDTGLRWHEGATGVGCVHGDDIPFVDDSLRRHDELNFETALQMFE